MCSLTWDWIVLAAVMTVQILSTLWWKATVQSWAAHQQITRRFTVARPHSQNEPITHSLTHSKEMSSPSQNAWSRTLLFPRHGKDHFPALNQQSRLLRDTLWVTESDDSTKPFFLRCEINISASLWKESLSLVSIFLSSAVSSLATSEKHGIVQQFQPTAHHSGPS